ncbi:uncharacterized protein LOC118201324 [Stegodyphus dumicola]|uniref:uncharacterized protein LOC118201324 n=1 Tax=Stegodyphus dumicola TaxID=202533 RepID=UPI0015AD879F|nr:uncharacterized protein LOC118201324 [Stegodyphus dumicola]
MGIDMAGHVYLKGEGKAWICLYTCAVYRAVHFELSSSLSTEAFLQSFRRFIARRGRPSVVYCDNGSNFVGASNCLKLVDWNVVAQYTTTKKIQWFFNPPTASSWSGFWKRLVGLMKQILRRVLGKSLLSFEEMTTVLCDAEFVISSRPLTYVSENESELVPLSPNSFFARFPKVRRSFLIWMKIDQHSLNKRLKYRQQSNHGYTKKIQI